MSGSSVDELRQLVASTLEHAGVLSKIRAQLRHHVFLAVHDQQHKQPAASPPSSSSSSASLRSSPLALLALDVIDEFLSFHALDYSAMTFDAEVGKREVRKERNQLVKELGLEGKAAAPVLLQLLQRGLEAGDRKRVVSRAEEEDAAAAAEEEEDLDASMVSASSGRSASSQWDKTPVKQPTEEEKDWDSGLRRVREEDEEEKQKTEGQDDDDDGEEEVEEEVEVEVEADSDEEEERRRDEPSTVSRPVQPAAVASSSRPDTPHVSEVKEEKTTDKLPEKKPSLLGNLPSLSRTAAASSSSAALHLHLAG